jgi:hypothetical protein
MLIEIGKYLKQAGASNAGVREEAAGTGLPECLLASLTKLFALEAEAPENVHAALPGTSAAEISNRLDAFAGRQQTRMEDMRQLLEMLAALTDSVSRAGVDSRRRLEEVERNLQSACRESDVASIRGRLERCLQSVRDESSARDKQRREQLGILDMGSAVVRAAGPGAARGGHRNEAIRKIDDRLSSGGSACVVFSFDQLDAVSERFGVRAAEAVMESYVRDVRMGLTTEEEIPQCAWGPRAMLLAVPGSMKESALRAAVQATPLQRTVPAGTRFATISLNVRWARFDGEAGGSTAAISQKIDDFLKR